MPRVPNIKAAEKWARQTEKRTLRNRDVKTRLKTLFKKTTAGADAAAISSVESAFDKAAQKGIIHPNKAARKKSRLARATHAAAPKKPAKAATRTKTAAPKAAAKAAPKAEPKAEQKPAPKRGFLGRVKKDR
jgi:small subunit ribosomal protein S20